MSKDQIILNEYDIVLHEDKLEKIKTKLNVLYESPLPNNLFYLNVYENNEYILSFLKNNGDIVSYEKTELFTLE